MKILLIVPKSPKSISYPSIIKNILFDYPTLSLETIVGYTPAEHKVTMLYEERNPIDFNWDGDVVGITCVTPQAPHVYKLADEFRRRGKIVILGGWHPSALPNEAKKHADAVVIGEAEIIWNQVLEDIKKGCLKPFYKNEKPVDLKNVRPAGRHFKPNISFYSSIQATRGCPMGCEFCGVSNRPYGRIFRHRPIDDVIKELKSIKQKHLWFYDPSLTVNTAYTKELFRRMKGLNKKFTCFGNIDALSKDDELLRLAKEAGCKEWFIGFESVSQKTINELGKKSNNVDQYASSIKKIHDHGMKVIGAFIFGFDSDTPEVFERTKEMILKLDIDIVELTNLTPYPGTPLFERLEKEGRIITKDWTKYTENGNIVFQPKNMSPKQLLEGTNRMRYELNSLTGIIKRSLINKNFLFRYLRIGLL